MEKSCKPWNAAKEPCFLWVQWRVLIRDMLHLWIWSYTQIYLQSSLLSFLSLPRIRVSVPSLLHCPAHPNKHDSVSSFVCCRPSCSFFSPFNCSFHKNSSPEWGDLYRKSSLVRSNRALPFISKVLLSIGLRENSFSAHLSHCATSSLLQ